MLVYKRINTLAGHTARVAELMEQVRIGNCDVAVSSVVDGSIGEHLSIFCKRVFLYCYLCLLAYAEVLVVWRAYVARQQDIVE